MADNLRLIRTYYIFPALTLALALLTLLLTAQPVIAASTQRGMLQQNTEPTTSDTSDPISDTLLPLNTLSAIEQIRARGNVLVAGVKFDFTPFGFPNDEGEIVGFDVDLISEMAAIWGVEVAFEQVTSANRIPKLAGGEVDFSG